jgi:hypothetical protein
MSGENAPYLRNCYAGKSRGDNPLAFPLMFIFIKFIGKKVVLYYYFYYLCIRETRTENNCFQALLQGIYANA